MQKKNIIISFIAGFLIGICGTVLTINIVNMHQRSLPGNLPGTLPETGISLKKTDQRPRELQQTRSDVDNVTLPKAAATGAENHPHPPPARDSMLPTSVKTDDKASVTPQGKDIDNLTSPKAAATGAENHPHPPPAGDSMLPTSVKTDDKASVTPQGKKAVTKSQDEIALNGIKVYIQYAREKDKKIAEAFSAELRTKGYALVDAENIKHRHRDIRYFHGEDKKAALLLRKQFNNFIAGTAYAKKVSLKIRYLGKIYPKAQKGSLELWVFF